MQQNERDGLKRLDHLWDRVREIGQTSSEMKSEGDAYKEQSLRARAFSEMKLRIVREHQHELDDLIERGISEADYEEMLAKFGDLQHSYQSAVEEVNEADGRFKNSLKSTRRLLMNQYA
jgi:hypothetical protein